MILGRVRLWAYALPLRRPLAARDGAGLRREGFCVELADTDGRTAWGEAAPLPAHGSETAEAALAGLRRFAATVGRSMPDAVPDGRLGAWLAPLALGPAARCAVEAALLGLDAARRAMALHRLLDGAAADRVAVAGLIDGRGDAADVAETATALAAQGHAVLKLKVGGRPPAEDVARVRAAARALPAGGALRLDGNRAWTAAEAPQALGALAAAGAPVAFVEEPCAPLPAGAALPLALDETLVGLSFEAAAQAIDTAPGLGAVVLKPTLLGFETAARLAAHARGRGLPAVVSSSFESGLGLRLAAALAAGCAGTAAGLGTAPWFSADLVPAGPCPAVIALDAPPVPDPALLSPLDA